jgi:hypothetical protein
MIEGRTTIQKAFLAGTTRRIQFQIVDKDTGAGFQPDTLTMSIYDVSVDALNDRADIPTRLTEPVTGSIVNDRDDDDVSAFVDSSGNVDLYLDPEDTEVATPDIVQARRYRRVVLFTWTWDTPTKTGKHEIVLSIVPDREGSAT